MSLWMFIDIFALWSLKVWWKIGRTSCVLGFKAAFFPKLFRGKAEVSSNHSPRPPLSPNDVLARTKCCAWNSTVFLSHDCTYILNHSRKRNSTILMLSVAKTMTTDPGRSESSSTKSENCRHFLSANSVTAGKANFTTVLLDCKWLLPWADPRSASGLWFFFCSLRLSREQLIIHMCGLMV